MNGRTHIEPNPGQADLSGSPTPRGFGNGCMACNAPPPEPSVVVPSAYTLPDATLDLLATLVVDSAAKRSKTEAA